MSLNSVWFQHAPILVAGGFVLGVGLTLFRNRLIQNSKLNEILHKREQIQINKKPNSTPVLLITDIGADIDDTFALLTSLGSEHTHLVGVVTAVNDGVLRASIVAGWLRLAGLSQVPILPSVDPAVAGCVVPMGFPSVNECTMGKVEDTPSRILEIAEAYGNDLVIVAIAPVTPLAEALLLDSKNVLRKIKRIYFQGNVIIDTKIGKLKPDPQAYNFRIHMGAAERVFTSLQDFVPFSFLGKFAAYAVGVTKKELEDIDSQVLSYQNSKNESSVSYIKSTNSLPCSVENTSQSSSKPTYQLPCLALMARDQMNKFRHGNFELWTKLYPVPPEFNKLHSMEWYQNLPHDVISHPYDPLLLLLVAEDCLFQHTNKWLAALNHQNVSDQNNESFYNQQFIGRLKNGSCHIAVGNNKEDCGVKDMAMLKQSLLLLISKGLDSCSQLKP